MKGNIMAELPNIGVVKKATTTDEPFEFSQTQKLTEGQVIEITVDGAVKFRYATPTKRRTKISLSLAGVETD